MFYSYSSTCDTGCLFNLARMRTMRGDITTVAADQWAPRRTVRSVQGPKILVPFIWAIFVPRSAMWASCPLCYWHGTVPGPPQWRLHGNLWSSAPVRIVYLRTKCSEEPETRVCNVWAWLLMILSFSTWPAIFSKLQTTNKDNLVKRDDSGHQSSSCSHMLSYFTSCPFWLPLSTPASV